MLTVRVRVISSFLNPHVEVRIPAEKLTPRTASRAAQLSGLSGDEFVVYDPLNNTGYMLQGSGIKKFSINL